ncbi:hypothetical protein Mterra_01223 [Calidithermus terrae]|uniref:Uncharacterized protein n=1 Tax=Calidithermus terrae TaxID=1408545 RepID=A0A399EUI0_9DEIN|nr:hypothetical protein [Calidithermus terrae]RIH87285.1 hypothetical protein Mterra_01223 [Calidithermus terrae]
MELHLRVEALPGFPGLDGAHELAWGYLLDRVFGDAYRSGVGSLTLVLPHPALEEWARWRAEQTPAKGGRTGFAALDGSRPQPADRVYALGFGPLAPAALRRRSPGLAPARLEARLYVYTLPALLASLPMRLNAPRLRDVGWLGMRRHFVSEKPVAAYYRLEIGGGA